MTNDEIIENIFKDVFNVFNTNKYEEGVVTNLIVFLDQLYAYTMFTEESINNIMDYIKTDRNIQDSVMDFVNQVYFRLKMNNLDVDKIFSFINDTTNKINSSSELDDSFKEQITSDVRKTNGIIINILYLTKIYGIRTYLLFNVSGDNKNV